MKEEIVADLGNTVICDICNKDWTDDPTSGGILVGSYAVCPDCEPKKLRQLKKYNEMYCINARCPSDMSFAKWIAEGRGPEGSKIKLITADDGEDFMDVLKEKFGG